MTSSSRAIINKPVIKCNGTMDTFKPAKLVCLNLRVMERLRKACMSHSEWRLYRRREFCSQSQTALLSQGPFPDPSQESSIFCEVHTPMLHPWNTHCSKNTASSSWTSIFHNLQSLFESLPSLDFYRLALMLFFFQFYL